MRPTRVHMLVLAALVAALALAFPAAAFAEHLSGSTAWEVKFNSNGTLTDNFKKERWTDDVKNLQPGDDITFTVNLVHENSNECDWYISNEVIKSLEEGSASGSAYGYELTYTGPNDKTSRTLYSSKNVGGDNSNGLKDATSGLKDFLYLDNLGVGESGVVNLVVTLDGETEGNAYFNTLAQLKMKFAVEYSKKGGGSNTNKTSGRSVVQAGDETNLFPFYVIMSVTGFALLLIAISMMRRNGREKATATRGAHRR